MLLNELSHVWKMKLTNFLIRSCCATEKYDSSVYLFL